MIAFLIAVRVPSRRFANTKGVNVSSRGSGPIRLAQAAPPPLPLAPTAPARRGAPLCRLRHRVAEPGNGEHPPAAHAERAVRVPAGARMEYERLRLDVPRQEDRGVELGLLGVAARRE